MMVTPTPSRTSDWRTPHGASSTPTHRQRPARLVHGRRVRRRRRPQRWHATGHPRMRALHAVRPHGLAPPQRWPDPLLHRRRRLRPDHGGPLIRLRPGDVVVTEHNEWHWHGTTSERFMVHLVFTEGETRVRGRPPHRRRVPAAGRLSRTAAQFGTADTSPGLTLRPGRPPDTPATGGSPTGTGAPGPRTLPDDQPIWCGRMAICPEQRWCRSRLISGASKSRDRISLSRPLAIATRHAIAGCELNPHGHSPVLTCGFMPPVGVQIGVGGPTPAQDYTGGTLPRPARALVHRRMSAPEGRSRGRPRRDEGGARRLEPGGSHVPHAVAQSEPERRRRTARAVTPSHAPGTTGSRLLTAASTGPSRRTSKGILAPHASGLVVRDIRHRSRAEVQRSWQPARRDCPRTIPGCSWYPSQALLQRTRVPSRSSFEDAEPGQRDPNAARLSVQTFAYGPAGRASRVRRRGSGRAADHRRPGLFQRSQCRVTARWMGRVARSCSRRGPGRRRVP